MNCYKKEITKNWLSQEDKHIKNLFGAFEVIKLHEEYKYKQEMLVKNYRATLKIY